MENDATNEPLKEFVESFCRAQKAFKKITKNTNNPFYNSKYADLETIIDATSKALCDNWLMITQHTITEGDSVGVETVLIHKGGYSITSKLLLKPTKNDPQGVGSAITYARRYCLSAILGVASEDDDDGNSASQQSDKPESKSTPKSDMPICPKCNTNKGVMKDKNKEGVFYCFPKKGGCGNSWKPGSDPKPVKEPENTNNDDYLNDAPPPTKEFSPTGGKV